MMHYGEFHYFGMHALWWIFWVGVVFFLLARLTSAPRDRDAPDKRPLEILQDRYARGELSTSEYEERKARLERDARNNRS